MECKEHLEVDVHRPWLGLVVCGALPARLPLCPALFLAKSPQFWRSPHHICGAAETADLDVQGKKLHNVRAFFATWLFGRLNNWKPHNHHATEEVATGLPWCGSETQGHKRERTASHADGRERE